MGTLLRRHVPNDPLRASSNAGRSTAPGSGSVDCIRSIVAFSQTLGSTLCFRRNRQGTCAIFCRPPVLSNSLRACLASESLARLPVSGSGYSRVPTSGVSLS